MPSGSKTSSGGAERRQAQAAPSLSTSDSALESPIVQTRRNETPIARAIRRQRCAPCREVTIELPFNDAGFLETTIVYPNFQHQPSNPLVRSTNSVAIFLHPWSRAGGNAHDPVLLSFLGIFLRRDYHVILYNSRGVGNSGGSASWSGLGEAQDLQVVVDLVLQEIEAVEEIVLLGYSYGSLAASFHPARPPSLFTAANLAHNPNISPRLRIRHVLVSYPVGVLWFLTMFRGRTYENKLKELVSSPGADVLVLYGERDSFTKKDKYRTWANNLKTANAAARGSMNTSSGSLLAPTISGTHAGMSLRDRSIPQPPKLKVEVVPDADHFWRSSRGTINTARAIVQDWLDEPNGGSDSMQPSPSSSTIGAQASPRAAAPAALPDASQPKAQDFATSS